MSGGRTVQTNSAVFATLLSVCSVMFALLNVLLIMQKMLYLREKIFSLF